MYNSNRVPAFVKLAVVDLRLSGYQEGRQQR